MKKSLRRLIYKLKENLKTQESFLERCKEHNTDPNFIDDVKITFQPLDVSAKTIDGSIILNEKLLESNDLDMIMRYILHESCHCIQQMNGLVDGQVDKDKYLDDENEQEAFQAQLEYMDDHGSPEEIQEYLEQLLDHHEIKSPNKRKKYIRELTETL